MSAVLLPGCRPGASVHLVPLGYRKIATTGPLVTRVKLTQCYYWIDDQENLCVAMRASLRSPFGKRFERESAFSFVLGPAPAGSGRDYRVGRRTMRARFRRGTLHQRAASLSGIVGVWHYDKSMLRGRFRLVVKEQNYSVLTGWRGNRRVLMVGEFKAIRDRCSGERILDTTEAEGMERSPGKKKPTPTPKKKRRGFRGIS